MQPAVNSPLVTCANVSRKQVLRLEAVQAARTDKLNELSCRLFLALLRAHFSQHVGICITRYHSVLEGCITTTAFFIVWYFGA